MTVAALMFSPLYFLSAGRKEPPPPVEKLLPPGAEDFALNYITLIRAHKTSEAQTQSRPQLRDAKLQDRLAAIAQQSFKGEPKSIRLVGGDIAVNPDNQTYYHLFFEYEFPGGWLGVETLMEKSGSGFQMTGCKIWELQDSVEHANRFTFDSKGYLHYMMLTLAIALLLFDLIVFIQCISLPAFRRQWLWALFILVGFFQISFNWTTGEFNWLSSYDRQDSLYDFFYVGIPVTQFFKVAYDPLVLRFSLPIGAMMFLSRFQVHRR